MSHAQQDGDRRRVGRARARGGPAGLLVAAVLAPLVAVLPAASAAPRGAGASSDVRISTVSTRADLVSGGDALVRVQVPPGEGDPVRVKVDGADVSARFVRETTRTYLGLLEGLRVGRHQVEAVLPDGRGARLNVTNHPRGGPIFSGPQIQPWLCTTADNGLGEPVDSQCNAPTRTSYLYQPKEAEPGAYEPYDPAAPPDDVATTRTSSGQTVPYIIRQDIGTIDRAIYRTLVLADPEAPWTPTRPQPQWDRTLVIAFGGGCGTPYGQKPPNPRGPIFGTSAGDGDIQLHELLSRGTMTGATGLNTLNQNCNPVVSAEAVVMLKELVGDTRGEVRRTITVGGSGGSVQQHFLASNYPGVVDGIVPTLSFPDLQGMTWDATDCYLTSRYFASAAPLWLDTEARRAVQGKSGDLSCGEFVALFADWNDPQNRGAFGAGATVRPGCGLPAGQAYQPLTNPTGPRCSVQDYQRNIWGSGGPRGAAPLPYDNLGVQYGLQALQDGIIDVPHFLDLNMRIGGIDAEGGFTTDRVRMSPAMAATFYRSGQTTDARRLADVPILDVREALDDEDPETFSDLHQPYNTLVMRERLRKANGSFANHVSWFPPPTNVDVAAVLAVDRWLDAIVADPRPGTRAQKVVRNRPRDVRDTCWVDGEPVTDPATCAREVPAPRYGGNARIAAGGPLSSDVRSCVLRQPERRDYRVAFTDAQWAALRAAFPQGVCDYRRPSIGQQPAQAWMTYDVVGGRPLGPAPVSVPFRSRAAVVTGVEPVAQRLPATGGAPGSAGVLVLVLFTGALALARHCAITR